MKFSVTILAIIIMFLSHSSMSADARDPSFGLDNVFLTSIRYDGKRSSIYMLAERKDSDQKYILQAQTHDESVAKIISAKILPIKEYRNAHILYVSDKFGYFDILLSGHKGGRKRFLLLRANILENGEYNFERRKIFSFSGEVVGTYTTSEPDSFLVVVKEPNELELNKYRWGNNAPYANFLIHKISYTNREILYSTSVSISNIYHIRGITELPKSAGYLLSVLIAPGKDVLAKGLTYDAEKTQVPELKSFAIHDMTPNSRLRKLLAISENQNYDTQGIFEKCTNINERNRDDKSLIFDLYLHKDTCQYTYHESGGTQRSYFYSSSLGSAPLELGSGIAIGDISQNRDEYIWVKYDDKSNISDIVKVNIVDGRVYKMAIENIEGE